MFNLWGLLVLLLLALPLPAGLVAPRQVVEPLPQAVDLGLLQLVDLARYLRVQPTSRLPMKYPLQPQQRNPLAQHPSLRSLGI
jgi:hypothetical protein